PAFTALAQTAAAPRLRLGFCFMPHGAVMANWTPASEGPLQLSPILAPLEAYKDQVVVISNLAHAMAGPQGPGDNGGDHTRCPAVFLNGVHPKRTDGADSHAVTSQVRRLQGGLGSGDRNRVAEYLDTVREIERRIELSEKRTSENLEVPVTPRGIPDDFVAHTKLMFDLMTIAFQADITRIS